MSKLTFLLVATMVAMAQAFAPISPLRTQSAVATMQSNPLVAMNMAEDTFWEGEYPPSKVLGPVMSKMSSGMLGVLSLVFLTMCGVSLAESAVLYKQPGAVADGSWVKWYYVLGSFGGPLAWGTHVACWIQRKNGM